MALDCDLRDLNQTIECLTRFEPDIVFHLAAHPDGREDIMQAINTIESNTRGTLHALEAFRLTGGGLFVYGDSCKVFGDAVIPYNENTPINPMSSYAVSKAAGWQYCKLYQNLYDCAVVSVRPTLIYGPRQAFNIISHVVRCAKQNKEVQLSGGSQTRDPLFIDDAIDAIVTIASKGDALNGRVVNIGGGHEYSIFQLATKILELMQVDVPIIQNEAAARPTDMWRSFCDNRDAQQLLGWQPKTDIYTGLRHTIAYFIESSEACWYA
jgi:UDP-glucose 4-epimerase